MYILQNDYIISATVCVFCYMYFYSLVIVHIYKNNIGCYTVHFLKFYCNNILLKVKESTKVSKYMLMI